MLRESARCRACIRAKVELGEEGNREPCRPTWFMKIGERESGDSMAEEGM